MHRLSGHFGATIDFPATREATGEAQGGSVWVGNSVEGIMPGPSTVKLRAPGARHQPRQALDRSRQRVMRQMQHMRSELVGMHAGDLEFDRFQANAGGTADTRGAPKAPTGG